MSLHHGIYLNNYLALVSLLRQSNNDTTASALASNLTEELNSDILKLWEDSPAGGADGQVDTLAGDTGVELQQAVASPVGSVTSVEASDAEELNYIQLTGSEAYNGNNMMQAANSNDLASTLLEMVASGTPVYSPLTTSLTLNPSASISSSQMNPLLSRNSSTISSKWEEFYNAIIASNDSIFQSLVSSPLPPHSFPLDGVGLETSEVVGGEGQEGEEGAEGLLSSMPAFRIFFYILYTLIFCVGIMGNLLVCYVVFRNKSMHTVTNFFITNLALSDILLCIFAVPFTPLYLLTFKNWIFGTPLCHLVAYAQGVSVYISAFTLMAIAVDRFFVIIHPFKPRMEIGLCVAIISLVWFAAGLLTLPYGWFVDVIVVDLNPYQAYCDEIWPFEGSRQAFGFTTSVLQFVIPFLIISYCYIRVSWKLRDRARSRPGAKSLKKDELERERTRRTNRMLIAMVVIFGVSWLPLNMYNLLIDFYAKAQSWEYGRAFFLLAHAAAMSSTCYNPFLYAWLNENFRKEFKQVLPCFQEEGVVVLTGPGGGTQDIALAMRGSRAGINVSTVHGRRSELSAAPIRVGSLITRQGMSPEPRGELDSPGQALETTTFISQPHQIPDGQIRTNGSRQVCEVTIEEHLPPKSTTNKINNDQGGEEIFIIEDDQNIICQTDENMIASHQALNNVLDMSHDMASLQANAITSSAQSVQSHSHHQSNLMDGHTSGGNPLAKVNSNQTSSVGAANQEKTSSVEPKKGGNNRNSSDVELTIPQRDGETGNCSSSDSTPNGQPVSSGSGGGSALPGGVPPTLPANARPSTLYYV